MLTESLAETVTVVDCPAARVVAYGENERETVLFNAVPGVIVMVDVDEDMFAPSVSLTWPYTASADPLA